jgi:hypothetical protein
MVVELAWADAFRKDLKPVAPSHVDKETYQLKREPGNKWRSF